MAKRMTLQIKAATMSFLCREAGITVRDLEEAQGRTAALLYQKKPVEVDWVSSKDLLGAYF